MNMAGRGRGENVTSVEMHVTIKTKSSSSVFLDGPPVANGFEPGKTKGRKKG